MYFNRDPSAKLAQMSDNITYNALAPITLIRLINSYSKFQYRINKKCSDA